MNRPTYEYTENPGNLSRREFLTIGGIVIALLALPAVWICTAVANRNEHIKARTRGLYADDAGAKVRVSHANAAVARLYSDFAKHPLSDVSEALFHTHHYIDRRKI
jgi:ferredoxin hydrogenase small subunit